MNIKEYKKILELLPLGFAFYDGNGNLVFANKKAGKISQHLFPQKFKNLNISIENIQKLNTGKTILVEDSLYYQLNIKPLKKMEEGCVILAQDTSNKKGYVYLATHDSITGLYNRGFFETEFERFKNGRDFPISIIYLDINKLKIINDKYGHNIGDNIIIKTGEIIKDSVRKYDIAARVGGDEFVILVPKADVKITERIIDRIHKKIEIYNKKAKMPMKVSVGYGVAQSRKNMERKLTEADQKMYRQKKKLYQA